MKPLLRAPRGQTGRVSAPEMFLLPSACGGGGNPTTPTSPSGSPASAPSRRPASLSDGARRSRHSDRGLRRPQCFGDSDGPMTSGEPGGLCCEYEDRRSA